MIELCLKVNAKDRLKSEEILSLDWVRKKMEEYHIDCEIKVKNNSKLIDTMHFPAALQKMG